MSKKPRALVLFSGGLDSRLVVKVLQEQLPSRNITIIYFLLPFGSKYPNPEKAKTYAKEQGVNLEIVDCTSGKNFRDYMALVQKPKFGYGTALNPCMDCKIFLLKKAKAFAKKNKIDIIATGEVLGQRPMSQLSKKLKIIEKETGLENKILRPLTAKNLEETVYEKKGLIDRDKLLDLQGRQRKEQMKLARRYNISYPTPAGGCMLCEKRYCEKIKPIFKQMSEVDVELSKLGRHYSDNQIVVGKNQKENEILEKIAKKYKKIIIIPKQAGPSAVVLDKKLIARAKKLIQKHSKNKISSFNL